MSRFREEDVLRFLDAAADPDPAAILDALIDFSGAERGFLVLRRDGELAVPTARHMDGEEVRRARDKVSRTLLERALAERRTLLASDADLSAVESLQNQKVRSVCVVPLPSSDGAVYLDHRFEPGRFADLGRLREFAARLDAALSARASGEDLVGASAPMRELRRRLDLVAAAPWPVLVLGESGTGKELVARALHRRSPRAAGPFVAANGAALPDALVDAELFGHDRGAFTGADRDRPGLFEQAHGGTLFLDEIACLSPQAQEALLRVIETGEVRRVGGTRTVHADVRIVAATNEDLDAAGSFRRDLFYRLNVLRLDLPALRDRREDLPALAERLLDRAARETGSLRKRLSQGALGTLLEHPWPGNVRELENALRRAVALSPRGLLEAADFDFLRETAAAGARAEILSWEEYIRSVLLRWEGKMDLKEIAGRLGISRKTLWEKKRSLGS